MTRSQIFTAAHKEARTLKAKFGGDYAVYLSLSLKNIYAMSKGQKIDINSIKNELIEKGHAYPEFFTNATPTIFISAEWTRCDDIIVTDIMVGFESLEHMFKGLSRSIELPSVKKDEDYEVTERNFKADCKAAFDGFTVRVKID